jgi:hypothetical protein
MKKCKIPHAGNYVRICERKIRMSNPDSAVIERLAEKAQWIVSMKRETGSQPALFSKRASPLYIVISGEIKS